MIEESPETLLELRSRYPSISAHYPWLDVAAQQALALQKEAKAPYSGVKVGACILARNAASRGRIGRFFSACNIELSEKRKEHAEQRALAQAVQSGHFTIDFLYVTSQSVEEHTAMCLECRQVFWKFNPDLIIRVLNPDGSLKMERVLRQIVQDYDDAPWKGFSVFQ